MQNKITKEIIKIVNERTIDTDNLIEEIVDVEIMIEQMKYMFITSKVSLEYLRARNKYEETRKFKVKRLKERIGE